MQTLSFKQIGEGQKTIIVLHELMGDSKNYAPILPYLDTKTFTYYFVDHRGYGLSKDMMGEYSCEEAAKDVIHLMDKLKLNNVNLLAHSMSTMIAQKVALLDKRITQLILITPLSAAGIKMKPQAQAKLLEKMKQNKTLIEEVVNSACKRYNEIWREYRIQMAYNASTLEARTGYMSMYLTTDFMDEIPNLTIPIKIMVGHHDLPAFNKLTIKKQFESYKDVEIFECMEAGHYPMIECPPYFVSTIENLNQQF